MSKVLNIIKVLINIFIYSIIIVLTSFILLVGYQKIVKKSNLIKIKDYYIFQIASGSMEDDYHIGDVIVAKKKDNYKIGDVITYESDNYYITHRIYKINDDKIITKGDVNKTLDDQIDKSMVVGKVIKKLSILTFIINHKFLIILIILIIYIVGKLVKSKGK